MGRPTNAEKAAKAAAMAAAEAEKKQAEQQAAESAEPTQTDATPGGEPTQTDETPETPAEDQQQNLDGKTCADCTRGKREDYHGLASVRCPLRPFLQRAWQQACPDCQL